MKSSKIIMLPLLSASFLLASCVEQQSTSSDNSRGSSQESKENSSENPVNSSESSKPTPDVPHSADENSSGARGKLRFAFSQLPAMQMVSKQKSHLLMPLLVEFVMSATTMIVSKQQIGTFS